MRRPMGRKKLWRKSRAATSLYFPNCQNNQRSKVGTKRGQACDPCDFQSSSSLPPLTTWYELEAMASYREAESLWKKVVMFSSNAIRPVSFRLSPLLSKVEIEIERLQGLIVNIGVHAEETSRSGIERSITNSRGET